MRKTIPIILGATLLVVSTAPFAAAAEHHRARKIYRAPAPASEMLRNSNAYYTTRPGPWAQSSWPSGYEDEAQSPPAGR